MAPTVRSVSVGWFASRQAMRGSGGRGQIRIAREFIRVDLLRFRRVEKRQRVEPKRSRLISKLEGDVHPLQSPFTTRDLAAPHQRAYRGRGGPVHRVSPQGVAAHFGPQAGDVGIERMLRTYEREQLHRRDTGELSQAATEAITTDRQT